MLHHSTHECKMCSNVSYMMFEWYYVDVTNHEGWHVVALSEITWPHTHAISQTPHFMPKALHICTPHQGTWKYNRQGISQGARGWSYLWHWLKNFGCVNGVNTGAHDKTTQCHTMNLGSQHVGGWPQHLINSTHVGITLMMHIITCQHHHHEGVCEVLSQFDQVWA